jgi:nucleoside 2-deoxyribosyltransferase
MKHRLDGAMFYLAGPMDDVPDRGSTWRKEITKWLHNKNIGVLCPYNKAIINSQHEDHKYYDEINILKKYNQFEEVHKKMRAVAADDYRMVDKADALILYIDKNAHMCGSYHENCMAAYQRKPVIVCCPQGISEIPNWIFSICRHEMFFQTLSEVKAYIEFVCHASSVPTYNRWRFFDYDKVFGRKYK